MNDKKLKQKIILIIFSLFLWVPTVWSQSNLRIESINLGKFHTLDVHRNDDGSLHYILWASYLDSLDQRVREKILVQFTGELKTYMLTKESSQEFQLVIAREGELETVLITLRHAEIVKAATRYKNGVVPLGGAHRLGAQQSPLYDDVYILDNSSAPSLRLNKTKIFITSGLHVNNNIENLQDPTVLGVYPFFEKVKKYGSFLALSYKSRWLKIQKTDIFDLASNKKIATTQGEVLSIKYLSDTRIRVSIQEKGVATTKYFSSSSSPQALDCGTLLSKNRK